MRHLCCVLKYFLSSSMIPFLEPRFARSRTNMMDLSAAILTLQTPEEIQAFLQDLCTQQELKILNERWTIAKLVHMGFSYRVISRKTGASSATISRVIQQLFHGKGELLKACQRRQDIMSRRYTQIHWKCFTLLKHSQIMQQISCLHPILIIANRGHEK